jgi:type I restriction enzyme S subunit
MTHHNTTPIVRFGDVAREVTESTHSPLEDGFEYYIGLEHLDPESLKIRRWGLIEETETTFTRVLRAGQVLFGRRRAYQRKAALAEFDGICSGDIIVMEAKPDRLLPELLPFIVQTEGFYEHALSTSAGSLSPRTRCAPLTPRASRSESGTPF